MFDFAWTEIALIGVVAMVLIGPKDMPVAIKAVANMVKKARRMAGEFQTHVDEMVRDTNLQEVRDSISEIRRMDIGGEIKRHVDADGTLHAALTDDPFRQAAPSGPAAIESHPLGEAAQPDQGQLTMAPASPPSFIPPAALPDVWSPGSHDEFAAHAPPPAPPAFIPPAAAQSAHPDH